MAGVIALLRNEARLASCAWRWVHDRERRPGEFGYHRALAPVLAVVAGLVVVEGAVTELVLALLLPGTVWPWVGLGLHVYGLAWIGALAASLVVRPHVLDATALRLRDGVFTELVVPLGAIRSARRATGAPATGRSGLVIDDDGRARLTHGGPDVVLELDPATPVRVSGRAEPLALRSVTVTVDDPHGLALALAPAR